MSQYGANNLAKRGYNAYQILKYFYANTKFARVKGEYQGGVNILVEMFNPQTSTNGIKK